MERARACDLAVLTAGRVNDAGGLVTRQHISRSQASELRDSGAAGSILGTLVDDRGDILDHDLNRRTIGLPLDDLAAIPEVVLTGSGVEKVRPLRAALRRGFAKTLVTDEIAAQGILAE